jgi:TetR/AcrR family transcriptional repressor of nem operon
MGSTAASPDTRAAILEQARFLIRTRGYSAFSYADLAVKAGITKAAVHYHFPTKEDLVLLLARDYVGQAEEILGAISARTPDAVARLRGHARIFADGFDHGMLPLCGALSAERAALPPVVHPLINRVFQIQLDWLAGVLKAGIEAGTLRADMMPRQVAEVLLSTLEGGVFIGWAMDRKAAVLASFETVLATIRVAAPRRGKKQAR